MMVDGSMQVHRHGPDTNIDFRLGAQKGLMIKISGKKLISGNDTYHFGPLV